MSCMYSCTCNYGTTTTQQSTADMQHSTNPPAAPDPVVSTETKTTGQVSVMFK